MGRDETQTPTYGIGDHYNLLVVHPGLRLNAMVRFH
jgi:hypothetical protein